MKQTFILLLAAITFSLTFKSYSQEVNITTDSIYYCVWTEGYWKLDSRPAEFISIFKVSKELDTITHIVNNRNWIYFVNDYLYDKELEQLELDITSDTGFHYTGVIDHKDQNIRFIFEVDGTMKLVRFKFKEVLKSKPEN